MISEKLENMLNDQLNRELFAGYLYLSISAYFESINLPGFANWFKVQAQEERDHAMIIFNYINRVGGRVRLMPIEGPKVEFASIKETLEASLEHERFVTGSINNIMDASIQEKDYKTESFLKWFIDEQVEEEDNAENNLRRYELVENDGKGILMLDSEFAARVYTPAPELNA